MDLVGVFLLLFLLYCLHYVYWIKSRVKLIQQLKCCVKIYTKKNTNGSDN